jgi:hypothetical protein
MAMTFDVAIYNSILFTRKIVSFSTFEESVAFVAEYNRDSDLHIKAQLVPFCD